MPRPDRPQARPAPPALFKRRYTAQRARRACSSRWAAPPSSAPAASSRRCRRSSSARGKGWLTAEYGMLPGSTDTRKPRDKGGKVDGRSVEIQRLIGRSLRAVVDLDKLGERTLWLDCDVLEADGGTRTASINGAFVALVDALHSIEATLPAPSRASSRDSVGGDQRRHRRRRGAARPRIRRGPRRRGGHQPGDDRHRRVHRGAGHAARRRRSRRKQLDRLLELGEHGIKHDHGRAEEGAGKRVAIRPAPHTRVHQLVPHHHGILWLVHFLARGKTDGADIAAAAQAVVECRKRQVRSIWLAPRGTIPAADNRRLRR